MNSGRKGHLAATDPVANQANVGFTSSKLNEYQREEMLEGGDRISLDLSRALPGATLRVSTSNPLFADPRDRSPTSIPYLKKANSIGNVQLPETMFRVQSPEGAVHSGGADGQEAVLRGDQIRENYPTRTDNSSMPAQNASTLRRQSRSDNSEGRHKKSSFNSDRKEQEASAFAGFKKAGSATAMQEASPEKIRSTRRAKAGVADVQDAGGMAKENRSSRSATRRARVEARDAVPEDGDLGMGDANRVSRRSNARPHLRQTKRKVADPTISTTTVPSSLPELSSPPFHSPFAPQFYPPAYSPPPARAISSSTVPREASGGTSARESSGWLLFIVDIVMWTHIPRSALLFGAGCFALLSTSLMQGTQYSAISIFAYTALVYLAAAFFKFAFLRGATSLSPPCTLTEADALKLIKVFLPTTNIILSKLAKLFSGEPIVTLKVAAALWLLAQAGHMMNLWTLSRIAYFGLFVIPKFYSSYIGLMHAQAKILLQRAWCTWDSCSYKKAVSFTAFILAWNFFSVSTRIFGAFISVVAVCVYQRGRRDEPSENENFILSDGNRPIRTHSAPPYGLQLMTLPQPNR